MWLLLLASIWGASYMLIKIGLRDLSAPMVAWTRIALAAAVLVPWPPRRGRSGPCVAGLGPWCWSGRCRWPRRSCLIALGEQEISSALAGILVATAPIFTAVLAIWVDHEERSEGVRLLGIVIGIAGVVALFGLDLSGSGSAVVGGLAIVLAGLGYAVGGFLVKHRLGDAPPIGVAAWVMVASTVWLLPAALATAPSSAPALGPVAAVAALGVVGTGLAFAIFYTLIARVGPARSFIVAYLAPGFAVVYGALLLGEQITRRHDRRAGADPGRLVAGGRGSALGGPYSLAASAKQRRHPIALGRPAPNPARPGR